MLLNCLSQNENFELKITDENFNLILNNPYFKEKIRINFECLWKTLYSSGHNNLLEKEMDLNNLEDLKFEQTSDNNCVELLKISKDKSIFKLSLLMIIDINYLKLLKNIFENIKRLDISISNLNK